MKGKLSTHTHTNRIVSKWWNANNAQTNKTVGGINKERLHMKLNGLKSAQERIIIFT